MDDFEQWMQAQFPDDAPEPEPPDLAAEVYDLAERHALSPSMVMAILQQLSRFQRTASRLHTFAKRCEAKGLARDGFSKELMRIVAHGLQRAVDAT
jgi:hypothetical protein